MFTQIYIDKNGQFRCIDPNCTSDDEMQARRFSLMLDRVDGVKYIQLLKDGCKWAAVSENDFHCAGVVISNFDEFVDVMKITVEDNFGNSKITATFDNEFISHFYQAWIS